MSNNWVRVPVVTLLALAVMASPALASKETAGRVYFVGGLGFSDVDVKDASVFEGETDGSDTAWQLGAGWYLNEWVGFEGASRVDLRMYWSRYFDVGDEQETGVRDYDALLLDVMFRLGPRKKK